MSMLENSSYLPATSRSIEPADRQFVSHITKMSVNWSLRMFHLKKLLLLLCYLRIINFFITPRSRFDNTLYFDITLMPNGMIVL